MRLRRRRGGIAHDLPGSARAPVVALLALLVGACSGASVAGDDTGLQPLVGEWRGVLLSNGGELPFRLRVDGEDAAPAAVVRNGDHETPFGSVERQGAASYRLVFVEAEGGSVSELVVKMAPSGNELLGYWRRSFEPATAGAPEEPVVRMPLSATRPDARRFQRNDPALAVAGPEGIAAVPRVAGTWQVRAQGEHVAPEQVWMLSQEDERVIATVEPGVEDPDGSAPGKPPGVGAPLEGIYRNGLLRLSGFDGHIAVLLHARATPEGALQGTLWRDDRNGAAWTARRVAGSSNPW